MLSLLCNWSRYCFFTGAGVDSSIAASTLTDFGVGTGVGLGAAGVSTRVIGFGAGVTAFGASTTTSFSE